MTDDELVLQARDGDADAFDQLVARHQSAVFRAALAALRNPEDAEEVAQDAFVRSWRSLHRFRGESSFRTWVLTIAWRRALSRRRRVIEWWSRRDSMEEVTEPIAQSTTESRVAALELHKEIAAAIRDLSPKLRDALLLANAGDYSYSEIASMLDTVEGTVKWRVSEARRKVRERLSKVGYVRI